jgi:hypothetical protein
LTRARPPPSPGRRSTRRASGSTGSDRGAWGDPLVTSAAGRPAGKQPQHGRAGVDRARRQTLADRGLQGSPATRSWRPASATWSGCPWSRRRLRSCCVWTRSRRSRRWSGPRLPAPTPGAARRAASAWSSDSPGRLRALPMTGWAGSGRLVHTSGNYASKALLDRCAASRAATSPGRLAAVNDQGLLGAVNVLVRVHMVGAGGVEPPVLVRASKLQGTAMRTGPFCRSRSTVGTKVKCSHRVQLSALPTRSERH